LRQSPEMRQPGVADPGVGEVQLSESRQSLEMRQPNVANRGSCDI
jgi:hypothetical protein